MNLGLPLGTVLFILLWAVKIVNTDYDWIILCVLFALDNTKVLSISMGE